MSSDAWIPLSYMSFLAFLTGSGVWSASRALVGAVRLKRRGERGTGVVRAHFGNFDEIEFVLSDGSVARFSSGPRISGERVGAKVPLLYPANQPEKARTIRSLKADLVGLTIALPMAATAFLGSLFVIGWLIWTA